MTRARDLSQTKYASGTWAISTISGNGVWVSSGAISFGITFDTVPNVIFSPDYRANPKYYAINTITTTGFTLYHYQISGATPQNSSGTWMAVQNIV